MPPVALVVPVIDEAAAIGAVVRAVPRDWVASVIVVDGGSRDDTVAVAREAGAEVVVEGRRGYGRACLTGVEAAAARGAEVVAFMDGDGSDRPEHLPDLLRPILDGAADFTIGSRARGDRERGSMGAHQLWAGRAIGFGVRVLYGVGYTDMCALRAIRMDVLRGLGMREMTYGWNLEMQMRVARARWRVLEVPVAHRRRRGGESKVSGTVRGTLRAGSRILATMARVALE
ncbi:MAG TPA: glycosyltransferase family 2 protein [Acetobacteraceae bacterium]|nr:glycosyltransferase family 2 protein [Acetobacteraceae bacterium]